MNILVIGNGFDIAHGLPTQYSDFLEYIQAINSYEISKSEGKLIQVIQRMKLTIRRFIIC